MTIKVSLSRFLGYVLFRDYVGVQVRSFSPIKELQEAREVARNITNIRLGFLMVIAVSSEEAVFGPHSVFMFMPDRFGVYGFILAMGGVLMLSIWVVHRVLGTPSSASPDDFKIENPTFLYRSLYRACSIFVLMPMAFLALTGMMNAVRDFHADRVAIGYQYFDDFRYRTAFDFVNNEEKQHPIDGQYMILAGYSLLRLDDMKNAKDWIEAGIVAAKTSFSKARGTYVKPIDRSSCSAYISQAPFPKEQQYRSKALEKEYCETFSIEFTGDADKVIR